MADILEHVGRGQQFWIKRKVLERDLAPGPDRLFRLFQNHKGYKGFFVEIVFQFRINRNGLGIHL